MVVAHNFASLPRGSTRLRIIYDKMALTTTHSTNVFPVKEKQPNRTDNSLDVQGSKHSHMNMCAGMKRSKASPTTCNIPKKKSVRPAYCTMSPRRLATRKWMLFSDAFQTRHGLSGIYWTVRRHPNESRFPGLLIFGALVVNL